MHLSHDMQQAVGHVMNVIVGFTALAAAAIFVGSVAIELKNRPRFKLGTLFVAMTLVALLLGLAASHR